MTKLEFASRTGYVNQNDLQILFVSDPADGHLYEDVCKLLESVRSATIWRFTEEPSVGDARSIEQLQQMDLLVIPITSRLFDGRSWVMQEALPVVQRDKISVLYLMMEQGLNQQFESVFAQTEYLELCSYDDSRRPLEERLVEYLDKRIASDEDRERVHEAFARRLFMSYRKKDRSYVVKLIEQIHDDEDLQDVAIWYDELLELGEDYNQNIDDSLVSSDLFLLAITPSIVEKSGGKNNYVVETEYPRAQSVGKPILPIGLVQKDREELSRYFADLPEIASADLTVLGPTLKELLCLQGGEPVLFRDPDSLYLLGIAYLYGIEVERRVERGIELLEAASSRGHLFATKRLANVSLGYGTTRPDIEGAIDLHKRYVLQVEEARVTSSDPAGKEARACYAQINSLLSCLLANEDVDHAQDALWFIDRMRRIATDAVVACQSHPLTSREQVENLVLWMDDLLVANSRLSDVCRNAGYDRVEVERPYLENVDTIERFRQYMSSLTEQPLDGESSSKDELAEFINRLMRTIDSSEVVAYQRLWQMAVAQGDSQAIAYYNGKFLEASERMEEYGWDDGDSNQYNRIYNRINYLFNKTDAVRDDGIDEAIALANEALDLSIEAQKALQWTHDAEIELSLPVAYGKLASLEWEKGDVETAVRHQAEAYRISFEMFRNNMGSRKTLLVAYPIREHLFQYGVTAQERAAFACDHNALPEAMPYCRAANYCFGTLLKNKPNDELLAYNLVQTRHLLGHCLRKAGRLDEARATFDEVSAEVVGVINSIRSGACGWDQEDFMVLFVRIGLVRAPLYADVDPSEEWRILVETRQVAVELVKMYPEEDSHMRWPRYVDIEINKFRSRHWPA